MILLCVGAVGIFDLFGCGITADTQDLVIVFLSWHAAMLSDRGEATLRANNLLGSSSDWTLHYLL